MLKQQLYFIAIKTNSHFIFYYFDKPFDDPAKDYKRGNRKQ